MKIRLGSSLTKFIIAACAAILVIGSGLDAYSNAINIITPKVTYILTALIVVGIPLAVLLEKKGQLHITYPNRSTFRFSDLRTIAVISGLLIVIWFPRFVGSNSQLDLGLMTQREVLEVPQLGVYEVFYPKPFASTPNLNFNKMIGNVYTYSTYQVLEQRRDGFKIQITSIGDGRAIEWIAVGPIN